MQHNKVYKAALALIALLFYGQIALAGGAGKRGRLGGLSSTIAAASGLAANVLSGTGSDEPGSDDDDFSALYHSLEEDSPSSYTVISDDDDDNGRNLEEDEVETKDEEPEEAPPLELMSPSSTAIINANILACFALLKSDEELADLGQRSSRHMQMRVRHELKRREAIYWLSQPELFQDSTASIMGQMLWATQMALAELDITPEYYEYLLEVLIGSDGKSGIIEHGKAYIRQHLALTLWNILESWKIFPERATSTRIDKVMIALIGEHEKGGLIRDSGYAPSLRRFALNAIAELLSNRDLLTSGRLSKENRSLLIESLIDEKIRKKMLSNNSIFEERDIIRAIQAVLKARVFYFEEEALLLLTLFGCDGDGGFSSAETHTYTLEGVAWVIVDIFPYHDKARRERFLNALVGKEGIGGILRHIDTTNSDPFAQWGAMGVIVALLKSDAPDLQERKRLMDALKSINSESAFLNEGCMKHVRPGILATAAKCLEALEPESVHSIKTRLTSSTLPPGQREELITLLIGKYGQGGFVQDEDRLTRILVPQALAEILASGVPGKSEREQLLVALIGNDSQKGLIGDESLWVRELAVEAIGTILASGTSEKEERKQLLTVLIGENGQRGLCFHARFESVREAGAEAIGVILESNTPDEEERALLRVALIGNIDQRGYHGGLIWDGSGSEWVQKTAKTAAKKL